MAPVIMIAKKSAVIMPVMLYRMIMARFQLVRRTLASWKERNAPVLGLSVDPSGVDGETVPTKDML
jgi:hypothetical protein